VVVLGVGTDSAYSHTRFADSEHIGFPLSNDGDGRVREAYGVLADELEGHRGVAAPALFVVDPDGLVQHAWRGETPDDSLDFDAVEKAVGCRDDTCAVPDGDGTE
jgi:peroxiredoxin